MSALGQKQTCALQRLMSALPPIATAKADIGKLSCPLYPRKRTCAVQLRMSALGQKRTLACMREMLFLQHHMDTFGAVHYLGHAQIGPQAAECLGVLAG